MPTTGMTDGERLVRLETKFDDKANFDKVEFEKLYKSISETNYMLKGMTDKFASKWVENAVKGIIIAAGGTLIASSVIAIIAFFVGI